MADTATGQLVKSKAGEFILSKLVDTGGTNVASVSAAGALKVDGSAATQPISAASLPLPSGASTSALQSNVQVADNAGFTDGTTTLMMGGFIYDEVAGTALTENDAAAARIDVKRAIVMVGEDAATRGQKWSISAAGALKVDGSAATQPVSATNLSTNVAQVGGTNTVSGGVAGTLGVGGVFAHDAAAAAALPVGIGFFASAAAPTAVSTDGDAVKGWALLNGSQVVNLASGGTLITVGSKVSASSIPVVIASDQAAVASNITQVGSATQSATNPLFVRLTNGTSAYVAGSNAPTAGKVSAVTSAALGAGSSVDLDHTLITNATTGHFSGADVGSTVPLKIEIKKVNAGTPATQATLFAQAFVGVQWRPPHPDYITQTGNGSTSRFRTTVTNLDPAQAADVYSTAYWDEQ